MISVIVPVYKVEPYLDRCVRSIVEQTYTDLEIILVDDGSPDNCPAMCDAWAERDSRIKVIHQSNAGAGAARNAALDIAKGDLIAFVDSDDYLSPDMYTHLYSLLEQGADIAECGNINVYDDSASFDCSDTSVHTYTAQEAMEEHIRDHIFRQLIWNKLYRREMIGDIRFPTGTKIDDEFFTYQVLGNAKTLIRSERICYAYRQQQVSIMHSLTPLERLQALDAWSQRQQYIERRFPQLSEWATIDFCFRCIYQQQMALRYLRGAERREAGRIIRRYRMQLRGLSPTKLELPLKQQMWLWLSQRCFIGTCQVRNLLKVGI